MKTFRKYVAALLVVVLAGSSALPAVAAESASEKEEVVYMTLSPTGTLQDVYVVNGFDGGTITDYGAYESVKMLNTNDAITQNGDCITFDSTAERVYYQGTLEDAVSPWEIALTYTLDGVPVSAEELAGQSGKLEIHFRVTRNEACKGSFFDDYALQAAFILDGDCCQNIVAPDATIASVGADKQLTYIILPGVGIDTTITADVREFTMDAVSINGVRLNLDVNVDKDGIDATIADLTAAVEKIDAGAQSLAEGADQLQTGTGTLVDSSATLSEGSATMSAGLQTLTEGMQTLQTGLDTLSAQSTSLNEGAEAYRGALTMLQTQVDSLALSSADLSALSVSSAQLQAAIADLSAGANQLSAALASSGAGDTGALVNANSAAITEIQSYMGLLDQLATVPGMEGLSGQLAASANGLIDLLGANNAVLTNSGGSSLTAEAAVLASGLSALEAQYADFDAAISALVTELAGLADTLGTLTDAIDQLVTSYDTLQGGLSAYIDGVAQVLNGYGQLLDGAAALTANSQTLSDGNAALAEGVETLRDSAAALADGACQLADGTSALNSETEKMDDEVDDKLASLLEPLQNERAVVSFVSEKNTNVDSLQFVIRTEAITVEDDTAPVTDDETEDDVSTFWEWLKTLF